jgi:RNA recognition motif-containing protein
MPRNKDHDKDDIYHLPVGDEWRIDIPYLTKLFVKCHSIIINTNSEIKERLKAKFQVDSVEDVEVYQGYAILTYKNKNACLSAIEEHKGTQFEGKDVLLGNSVHHLGRGRHEIIRYYHLTSVVFKSKWNTQKFESNIRLIAEKHGEVKTIVRKKEEAWIKFALPSSVISFLAIENDGTYCPKTTRARLDNEVTTKLRVKKKFLPLIYFFCDIWVGNLTD